MKFGSLGAAVAAVSLGFMPVAHAQSVTIAEFIQVMGDLKALEKICPKMVSRKNVFYDYMDANGISTDMVLADGGIGNDVMKAMQKRFDARKAASVADNCADAIKLYGDEGTAIKGFLDSKATEAALK